MAPVPPNLSEAATSILAHSGMPASRLFHPCTHTLVHGDAMFSPGLRALYTAPTALGAKVRMLIAMAIVARRTTYTISAGVKARIKAFVHEVVTVGHNDENVYADVVGREAGAGFLDARDQGHVVWVVCFYKATIAAGRPVEEQKLLDELIAWVLPVWGFESAVAGMPDGEDADGIESDESYVGDEDVVKRTRTSRPARFKSKARPRSKARPMVATARPERKQSSPHRIKGWEDSKSWRHGQP